MRSKFLIGSLLASAMLAPAAFAQQPAQPAPKAQAQNQAEAPALAQKAGQWRASKVTGLNVYNQQNEKLGSDDIRQYCAYKEAVFALEEGHAVRAMMADMNV